MNSIGKVDCRCTGRQADEISAGGNAEHVLGRKVGLYRADNFFNIVRLALIFEHSSNPSKTLLKAFVRAADTLFILPMGSNTVFGGIVHIPGTNLNLKWCTLFTDYGSMKRLVHVRFWR